METHFNYKANCNSTVFSDSCIAARKEIKNSLQGLNIYDVYRNCPKANTTNLIKEKKEISRQKIFLQTLKKINLEQKKSKLLKFFEENFSHSLEKEQGLYNLINNLKDEDEGIWPDGCLDDPFPNDFFNKDSTKEKLNVRKEITYEQCNAYINMNYKFSDSLKIYNDTLLNSGLRLWFYSGDTDGAVPFTGTIKWLPKLNMDITEPYRKWVVNEQTAGYVQSYDSMVFVTILGTGHMAPQWKREEAFTMFNAFLKGERLPTQ